jgi:UDP-hydrolysing UDP-N-acetyl-D-glucosamine 2-epimerase
MTRKVCVFTGTRAEYGLLYWLMRELEAHPAVELQIIVGGSHLVPQFGNTKQAILDDGFCIAAEIDMLLASDSRVGVAKAVGLGTIGLADALDRLRPDLIVLLGDRFELLAAAQAALILGIPIAHIHGGEITEGAYDDSIRHAVSKMSHLHFVAAETYGRRLVQMGETPQSVFNVGALGLDHVLLTPRMAVSKVAADLGLPLQAPFILATYHPVTQGEENASQVLDGLEEALNGLSSHQIVFTYPNADHGGTPIIARINAWAAARPRHVFAVPSLGFRRYLSLLANAAAVVGNSSSGIIEAPAFKIPTVNIGRRQHGRLSASSVIHCGIEAAEISQAVRQALSPEFKAHCIKGSNPYGQGNAARLIVERIAAWPGPAPKRFFDMGGFHGAAH